MSDRVGLLARLGELFAWPDALAGEPEAGEIAGPFADRLNCELAVGDRLTDPESDEFADFRQCDTVICFVPCSSLRQCVVSFGVSLLACPFGWLTALQLATKL